MKILGNRVLLEQLPVENKAGSFWLPDNRAPEQQLHRVIALGSKVTEPLSMGDIVLVDQYSINSRTQTAQGHWIIDVEHLSLAVGSKVDSPP